MIEKRVIILAGGHGSRVKKYFPELCKPLFPINGIPIIERQISMFKDYTIFINCNKEDAPKLEYLRLPLLVEKERIGNAGVLYFFRKELGKKFLVYHCDEFTDLYANDLWDAHEDDAAMTMVIKNIRKEKEFGLVTIKSGRVDCCTKDRYVNTGIYCCTDEIFNYIDGNKFQDLDIDLFPKLIDEGYLYYYEHKGYWEDIGTEEFISKSLKKGE